MVTRKRGREDEERREKLNSLRRRVVRSGTADMYDSIFEDIWAWSQEKGSPVISRDTLIDYVLLKSESRDPNRPNKIIAALNFAYALYPERFQDALPFWREYSLNHYIFRGLKEEAREKVIPPGAIDMPLFARMVVSLPFLSLPPMGQIAVRLMFLCALRKGELMCMTSSDFDQKSGCLLINQNKGARTTSGKPQVYSKLVVLQDAIDLLVELAQQHPPETRLFPYQVIPMRKVEDCIKETATALKWNPKFRWSIHSLRHGGMQAIQEELVRRNRTHLLDDALKVSDNVKLRYLRPNKDRLRLIRERRVEELQVPDDDE